jgi:hypothetical protein
VQAAVSHSQVALKYFFNEHPLQAEDSRLMQRDHAAALAHLTVGASISMRSFLFSDYFCENFTTISTAISVFSSSCLVSLSHIFTVVSSFKCLIVSFLFPQLAFNSERENLESSLQQAHVSAGASFVLVIECKSHLTPKLLSRTITRPAATHSQ